MRTLLFVLRWIFLVKTEKRLRVPSGKGTSKEEPSEWILLIVTWK